MRYTFAATYKAQLFPFPVMNPFRLLGVYCKTPSHGEKPQLGSNIVHLRLASSSNHLTEHTPYLVTNTIFPVALSVEALRYKPEGRVFFS